MKYCGLSDEGGRACAPSVLVVDDNRHDRKRLADFLGQQGFRVYVAGDGLDGLRKARSILPDLVLMDIVMPARDGPNACRQLKDDDATKDIPLIFLSASAQQAERVAGLAAGAIDYIIKPFHFEEIRLRLAIHMGLRAEPGVDADPRDDDEAAMPAAATSVDMALLRSVRAVVRGALGGRLDSATLAQTVGTTPRRLALAFRRCAGMTVADYVREERLTEARRLLTKTALDVQAIATAVGYSSGANFATAFRKRFGATPGEARRAAQSAS